MLEWNVSRLLELLTELIKMILLYRAPLNKTVYNIFVEPELGLQDWLQLVGAKSTEPQVI